MTPLKLDEFGYHGIEVQMRGTVEEVRKEGNKLLFLFKEQHENPSVIEPNVRNALQLIALGVVGCIGVEEYPFKYAGKSDGEVRTKRDALLARYGTEDAVLESIGYTQFGSLVKLIRPDFPVASVEDPDLFEQASEEKDSFEEDGVSAVRIQKYAELAPHPEALSHQERFRLDQVAEKLAKEQLREDFGLRPINILRDGPMLDNLMIAWEQAGFDKAAILNCGAKHIDRIKRMLPEGFRYIVISQS